MKPILPFPIAGPFIFVLKTGSIISAQYEGENIYSFESNGRINEFNVNEYKKITGYKLFLNDKELYFFLKEGGLLPNFNLESWESEIYLHENLWLYDEEHDLSEVEIEKFKREYDGLGRIRGLKNWNAWQKHENNPLVKGFKKKDPIAFEKAIKIYDEEIEPGVAIAAMPSSQKNQWGAAGEAAKLLCGKKDRIDCSELFYRFKDSQKQQGLPANDRVPETHFNSIRLNKEYLHLDKKYYILDDVITTGVSLNSVKAMLKLAGIKKIRVMALGNTLLA